MTFRDKLQKTDPDTIYKIVTDTDFFRPEECQIARELAAETLEKPDEYLFIFAEEEKETAGYICYAEIPGTAGSYELYWLAVLKQYQRKGIGKSLITMAEKDIAARGGRQIYISTSGSALYSGTRAAYENAGYEKAATLKDFYLPGDDQVIYMKKASL